MKKFFLITVSIIIVIVLGGIFAVNLLNIIMKHQLKTLGIIDDIDYLETFLIDDSNNTDETTQTKNHR